MGCELAEKQIWFLGVKQHIAEEQEHCKLCWTVEQ
jgi:hypothetical protein